MSPPWCIFSPLNTYRRCIDLGHCPCYRRSTNAAHQSEWHRNEAVVLFSPNRAIVADGCFANPLQEALQQCGLTASQPTSIDDFGQDVTAKRRLMEAGVANSLDFWSTIPLIHGDITFDWFIASFINPCVPLGVRDTNLRQWLVDKVEKIGALADTTSLRAAMLLVPTHIPDGVQAFKNKHPTLPDGWKMIHRSVCNLACGGRIETRHEVLLFMPVEVAEYLPSVPAAAAVGASMGELLNHDTGWIHDEMDLNDIEVLKVSNIQRESRGETAWAPRATQAVRIRQSTRPIGGFPAFDRARSAPGEAALSQIIVWVHQAESTFEQVHGHIPLLMADPTPSTVIPLPTQLQWQQASQQDTDVQAVMQALQHTTPLRSADLEDKRYLRPFTKEQFEQENGILHAYETSRAACIRQLRTRVVLRSLRQVVVTACHSSPFGGHSGFNRINFRIQSMYWWPGMRRDVEQGGPWLCSLQPG
eukprot:scaffold28579_cov50-Attheya_sp.AAC.1